MSEQSPKRKGRIGAAIRTIVVTFVLLGVLGGFGYSLWFLYQKSLGEPPVVKTEKATLADIIKKSGATGSIVPRKEVFIKPRVSGIVKRLHVVAGDRVKEGDLIAEVVIIPDVVALTRAEGQVRSASIAVKHAELELKRTEKLTSEGLASAAELSARKLDFEIRQAELMAAHEGLTVTKEGAIAKSGQTSNTKIVATVAGTVLDVPVLEGASVIESNNFNDGTTVAVIADMSDMIFVGKVDEADVGRIAVGMDVSIQIGAIEGKQFPGVLESIASKGKLIEGSIQFEVKAALKPIDGIVIRAGYSANAAIVLDKRTQVLALNERLLQFENRKPFVEVVLGEDRYERRDVKVGLSDGLVIEVLEGITAEDEIKVPTVKGEEQNKPGSQQGRGRR